MVKTIQYQEIIPAKQASESWQMNSESGHRPTRVEIDLDNLAHNFRSIKEHIGVAVKIMAVVKADAYGHGAVQCATRLEAEGIDWFGVALPEEGVELREAGIKSPILCLGGIWKNQEELIFNHRLTPVVYRVEHLLLLQEFAKKIDAIFRVHVKIDTGMNRIGVRFDEVKAFAETLKEMDHLEVEGIMTHFASADDLDEKVFTSRQIARFEESVRIFVGYGFNPEFRDLANSPATFVHPESRGNMVRLGGVLYGLGDDILPESISKPQLKPVMALSTEISHLNRVSQGETIGYARTFIVERDSLIGTIPIGYQDGYRRGLSNCASAIIRGKLVPIVGRVSMDWTLIDLTDIENAAVGDRVILIGSEGSTKISAADLARLLDTISYEITCAIDKRVKRIFKE